MEPYEIMEKICRGCREIVEALGLGGDEHTQETVERMANALIELCHYHIFPKKPPELTTFITEGYNEIIICKDIPFFSICKHHLMVFSGVVHIAYLPKERIVGLSKLPRVVDYFSRRPQVQELLVQEIADFIFKNINPEGVMVIAEGEHQCCACRGIKSNHTFVTSAVRGCFEDKGIRDEALKLIYGG